VVTDLRDAMSASGIGAQDVKVKLTEGALIGNPQVASAVLDGLKELGLGIAIDDFGTGYSSLSDLHRVPIDTLKIDRSFVTTMLGSDTSLRIVQSIVGLAKALDMTIVAEGIENEPEVGALAGLECEYGQGYLFSKPLSPDAATDFAVRGRPNTA
jgi:EAL domain-containing protein (putative c-di-GMP-specific phosphodiesterase class I)